MSSSTPVELRSIAELYRWLQEHSPKTILLCGLEDAIVGVVDTRPGLASLVYSKARVIELLAQDLDTDYDGASVYFERELGDLYELHGNPVFIEPLEGVELDGE